MVTGFSDLSNEFAPFVSAVHAKERQQEQDKIIQINLLIYQLKVIPLAVAAGFSLEHYSNMAWLSVMLHKHHDNWVTIAISPCLNDMQALTLWFFTDNAARQSVINVNGKDLGRSSVEGCFNSITLQNKYQVTILHPRRFHPHPEQTITILGTDGHAKEYRTCTEGVLKDKDGVPLPPFSSPSRPRETQLNPILVNFAAALRFRRLKRMDRNLLDTFSSATHAVINASLELYDAVMWTPVPQKQEEGSVIHVGSTDAGDVEMGAGPSAASGGMEESGDADPEFDHLLQTLGPMDAMDVILGGYEFEALPDLVDDGENGVAFHPRPTTPPDDEDRWDVIPAEVSGTA
ncbi:hypothetical protein C8R44DRAFT_977809 [Mycena epipterygia]|nr:hypothetical protein C8R44DRAFT_977809 [Mycena epipterygia]